MDFREFSFSTHSGEYGQEEEGPGSNTPALPLLHAPPLYDLVVKVQLFC